MQQKGAGPMPANSITLIPLSGPEPEGDAIRCYPLTGDYTKDIVYLIERSLDIIFCLNPVGDIE